MLTQALSLQNTDLLCVVCQAFGISSEELEHYVSNGIIDWGEPVRDVLENGELFVNQTRCEKTPLITVLLEGQRWGGGWRGERWWVFRYKYGRCLFVSLYNECWWPSCNFTFISLPAICKIEVNLSSQFWQFEAAIGEMKGSSPLLSSPLLSTCLLIRSSSPRSS